MIVVDESRHAALAFKTLRWLLDQKPALRAIIDEERAALDPGTRRLVAPLFEAAFDEKPDLREILDEEPAPLVRPLLDRL